MFWAPAVAISLLHCHNHIPRLYPEPLHAQAAPLLPATFLGPHIPPTPKKEYTLSLHKQVLGMEPCVLSKRPLSPSLTIQPNRLYEPW